MRTPGFDYFNYIRKKIPKTILWELLLNSVFTIILISFEEDIQKSFKFAFIASSILIVMNTALLLRKLSSEHLDAKKDVIKKIMSEYGIILNEIFKDDLRFTIYIQDDKKNPEKLIIYQRFNDSAGSEGTTWPIDEMSPRNSKGVAGKAWSEKSPKKYPRLLSYDEITQKLASNSAADIAEVQDNAGYLGMTLEEVRERAQKPNRPYLFPIVIYANPINLSNGERIVLVIDSDKKASRFHDEFEKVVARFSLSIQVAFDS